MSFLHLCRYPEGDPEGRRLEALLGRLREVGVDEYTFSHIKVSHTFLMLREFRRVAGGDGWLTEDRLGREVGQLREQVGHSIDRSMAF